MTKRALQLVQAPEAALPSVEEDFSDVEVSVFWLEELCEGLEVVKAWGRSDDAEWIERGKNALEELAEVRQEARHA